MSCDTAVARTNWTQIHTHNYAHTPLHTHKPSAFINTVYRGPNEDRKRMISSFWCTMQTWVFGSSNVEQISSQRMYVRFFLFFSTLYTFLITSRSRMAYISLMVQQKFDQHTAIRKKIFRIFPRQQKVSTPVWMSDWLLQTIIPTVHSRWGIIDIVLNKRIDKPLVYFRGLMLR